MAENRRAGVRLLQIPLFILIGLVGCGGGRDASLQSPTVLAQRPAECQVTSIFVTVEGVRIKKPAPQEGWSEIPVTPSRQIDLQKLQQGLLRVLGLAPLPAGAYSEIWLVFSPAGASVQRSDSSNDPLSTPAATSSGLKLLTGFQIQTGRFGDVVPDGLDGCDMIVAAGDRYLLKPQLKATARVVDVLNLDRSASKEGPDLNNNGIRDDIDMAIDNYPVSAEQKPAMRQVARGFQKLMSVMSQPDANAAGLQLDKGLACLALTTTSHFRIARYLQAATFNTELRFRQYIAFERLTAEIRTEFPIPNPCEGS